MCAATFAGYIGVTSWTRDSDGRAAVMKVDEQTVVGRSGTFAAEYTRKKINDYLRKRVL